MKKKKEEEGIRDWYKEEKSAVIKGLSKWTVIVFRWKKNNAEFYRVERNPEEMKLKPDQFVRRHEYFNGKLERTYEGWKHSFVEFIDLMDKHNTSPDKVDLEFYSMHMPLQRHEIWLYKKYYLECFGSKQVSRKGG
jgi:hypothetical protein